MDTTTITAVRELLTARAIELELLPRTHDEAQAEVAIERLLDAEVITPEPTDEERSRYYALHPEAFTSGDLVFARHILFAVTSGAPIALIRQHAEKVLHEARAHPEQFGELAAQHSNCPSAQRGGSLGQLGRGDCVPEFERPLFEGRSLGVLPQLVNTRFGFHIVAVDQRVPGCQVSYDAVKDQIAARLYAQVQEKAMEQYVRVLAAQRKVDIPGVARATSPLVQ
jgi:peptidyl-prolyl cis-trans isomerase C